MTAPTPLHTMAFLLCLALAGLGTQVYAQTAARCPVALDATRCFHGVDQNGAQYWIALPEHWNHMLILHAHGGPRLSPVSAQSNVEDLARFAVTVRRGYAWAGSTYRRPGYGVRMAAEDTETLRKIFIHAFGQPRHTLLHGQSWGGNVAAKGIELYATNADGTRNYDGAVITNGMLAGGTLNYLHRADLRAVYQYYCHNHPRPDEPQYPLWMGLPAGAGMRGSELEERVNDCTGVRLPAGERNARQKQNLRNILAVVPVPERTLVSHLNWATFMFRDLTQRVLGGRNPFANRDVAYHGSDDDAALNAGVARFSADPDAVRQLADDSDMQGNLQVPVLTMHAIDDPTALVEYEAAYGAVVQRAGGAPFLRQTFTREHEHSKLSDAEYAALFDSLVDWIDTGAKPAVAALAARCVAASAHLAGGCHFDASFVPGPLFSRVAPRSGDTETRPPVAATPIPP